MIRFTFGIVLLIVLLLLVLEHARLSRLTRSLFPMAQFS